MNSGDYINQAALESMRVLIRTQHAAAHKGNAVNCPCGQLRALTMAYRCLYCGVWFCFNCAQEHFGMTVKQFRANKDTHPQPLVTTPP